MLAADKRPDIMHCHDWQTGLVPVLLHEQYSGAVWRTTISCRRLRPSAPATAGCSTTRLLGAHVASGERYEWRWPENATTDCYHVVSSRAGGQALHRMGVRRRGDS